MTRKISPRTTEALERALRKGEQTALAISRRKTKIRHAMAKFRVRRMMEMAGEVIRTDLALIGDPAAREAIARCRKELAEVRQAAEAAGIPTRTRGAPRAGGVTVPSPEPTATDRPADARKALVVAFRNVPPAALRNRLKTMQFRYDSNAREWRGYADPAVVRAAIDEGGAGGLLRDLREDSS